jgi:asparagine synthase (glutamine-hydrolysing)
LLSGGLDSSALTAIAASVSASSNNHPLTTCSVDYENQADFFQAHDFQPDCDADYIEKMQAYVGSSHRNIVLCNDQLIQSL